MRETCFISVYHASIEVIPRTKLEDKIREERRMGRKEGRRERE